jgi:hypothetical protein
MLLPGIGDVEASLLMLRHGQPAGLTRQHAIRLLEESASGLACRCAVALDHGRAALV